MARLRACINPYLPHKVWITDLTEEEAKTDGARRYITVSATPDEARALAQELLVAAEKLEPSVSGIGAVAMLLEPPVDSRHVRSKGDAAP